MSHEYIHVFDLVLPEYAYTYNSTAYVHIYAQIFALCVHMCIRILNDAMYVEIFPDGDDVYIPLQISACTTEASAPGDNEVGLCADRTP